ncbi:peptide chain release factor eRF1 [Cotonvirus japonicus]|uniref:Peptide chain release factor eRF1 n=1 Tax=Cotonvirus japonicus TaxID=2811091 RepID=A0ABM7NRY1_9VIRU|nr:peptide chain release factor eRF1 [Cotonvirus japonicus]BCS82920.1 peptide chain release factor eRF1 [Cotonvirus japonicus]
MTQTFISDNKFICQSLIIAGPGEIKTLLTKQELFIQHFQKYLIKILTISEINDKSIHSTIELCKDIFHDDDKIFQQFETILINPKFTDKFVFGTHEVNELLLSHNLETIYISSNYNDLRKIINLANQSSKINIFIVKTNEFQKKYGDLVGIKYIVSEY